MERKKVLVVDDEMDMRIFMKTLLETSGYSPIITKNGKEGIRKAKEEMPALVVLDVMMPQEGGAKMYRHLRTDEALKDIPVIMLSGVEKKTYVHYLKMLNAQTEDPIPEPDVYLEKPPEPEKVLAAVRSLIG